MLENILNTVGIDEAGRGCLFGPVVAAAVVLPDTFPDLTYQQIKDSKKLSEKQRAHLETYIKTHAIAYAIGTVDATTIDQINILNATLQAMHQALDQIPQSTYTKIYIDGTQFKPYHHIPYTCVPKGDNIYLPIAAASILAKCHRDRLITEGCLANPTWDRYALKNNKGYGTKAHLEALQTHGPIEGHRLTFARVS